MTKKNIKTVIKSLEQLIELQSKYIDADLAMDGSGECSGFIYASYSKQFKVLTEQKCEEEGITTDELLKWISDANQKGLDAFRTKTYTNSLDEQDAYYSHQRYLELETYLLESFTDNEE